MTDTHNFDIQILSPCFLCPLLTTLKHSNNSLTRRTVHLGGLKDGHSLSLSCDAEWHATGVLIAYFTNSVEDANTMDNATL